MVIHINKFANQSVSVKVSRRSAEGQQVTRASITNKSLHDSAMIHMKQMIACALDNLIRFNCTAVWLVMV